MADKRAGEKSGGYMLMKPLVDTADIARRARRIRRPAYGDWSSTADGRVVGVIATQYGKRARDPRRPGVVLATGSFAYNDAMVAGSTPRA